MAESAVKSAADLLGKILVEEGKYLWGAEAKVEELRDELLWMQSFLREADTVQYKDETVRMWVYQIEEYVSEAEDIIDDFIIKVASHRRRIGLLNKLKRYSCIFKELFDVHEAASSIDSLKDKISTLSPKLEKYGLKRSLGISGADKAQEALTEQVQQSLKYAHIEDKKIVGLEKNAQEMIATLKSTASNRGFHAIYGMGGLGKTTLATKVLQSDGIKRHFTGGQAFAYVSKQFQVESVLQDLLKSLNSNSSDHNPSRNELVSTLHQVLKTNKCLVVLDDVWTQQAWDRLKPAFTSCGGGGSSSQVLLTTRKEEVAKYVDPMAHRKPDPLNDDESWELLQKTIGWDPKEITRHGKAQEEIVGSDVHQKVKLGKEMVNLCSGLPLAIVVLGGILRKKQTLAEWDSVHKNIGSYLRMGFDHGRSCMEILLQSYNDLPYHLKPCFLHLANFPEDYEIDTENLYRMWVAEGLVTRSCDRTARTKSLEDVANDYLSDLAQVSLVEIVDKTSQGWIKSIRMHDLVRDVCLEKATADKFLIIIDLRPSPDQQQLNNSDHFSRKRLLRMSIYLPAENINSSSIQDCLSSKAPKYLRSLLFIPHRYVTHEGQCHELMTWVCNEFQLLRALVLESMNLSGKLTSQVENLMHLRYLSLAKTHVSELPPSIGNLRFLEILDLRVKLFSTVLKIPNTLWQLLRLRHLLLPIKGYEIKKSQRLQIDTLICLEMIENLQVKNLRTKDLLKLKNLRKLSIKDQVSEEAILDIILKSPVLKSGVLGNCSLGVEGDIVSKKPSIMSGIVCNLELRICGQISVPVIENVELSQHLEVLKLDRCQFKDDPMRILGSLCRLRYLALEREAYDGKKMSCHSKSFPVLTELRVFALNNLEVWTLEHGAMPKLKILEISHCGNLNVIPDVLPSSLESFKAADNGQRRVDSDSAAQIVHHYDFGKRLKDAVFSGRYDKVVLSGKDGAGKATNALQLYVHGDVKTHFDAVVRTCVPRNCSAGRLPWRILEQLLMDLDPKVSRDEGLFPMSYDKLINQIQQAMQANKCLVILLNLEDVDHLEDLDQTFGRQGFQRGSKLVITSNKEPLATADATRNRALALRFRPPTLLETWQTLHWETTGDYNRTNAGIKWNMLRHCSGHLLSSKMLVAVVKMKENIAEWAAKHEELIDSRQIDFSQIFALCYNDLPLHLRPCLIYLANFPEDVEISTHKLYQMWIAAGFVRSKDDGAQTEEFLENLAFSYLTELVQREMIIVVKQGPAKRAKTCQLRFALRELCLEKAKEEHILTIVDQIEHTTSASNSNLKTQQLAVHVNEIHATPASFDEQLSSLNLISSPTSLIIFPNAGDPLYNEEKWEWLLYICKHFQLLRVLDLERWWMTKGSLPKEVGNLGQLRYLSLRGTWVSQLPPSIGNLRNLQTLDLRVLESIVIPDVLWKLNRLIHLYLPDFIARETAKLRLRGLNCLQTLVSLHTDRVHLNELRDLKLLRKISIKKIQAVDELDDILKSLSTSLDVCINSEIINASPTILASFHNLHKLKIKGMILVELNLQMFPTHLKELTLKHTKLEQDPLPVLERLLELRSLFFRPWIFLRENNDFF